MNIHDLIAQAEQSGLTSVAKYVMENFPKEEVPIIMSTVRNVMTKQGGLIQIEIDVDDQRQTMVACPMFGEKVHIDPVCYGCRYNPGTGRWSGKGGEYFYCTYNPNWESPAQPATRDMHPPKKASGNAQLNSVACPHCGSWITEVRDNDGKVKCHRCNNSFIPKKNKTASDDDEDKECCVCGDSASFSQKGKHYCKEHIPAGPKPPKGEIEPDFFKGKGRYAKKAQNAADVVGYTLSSGTFVCPECIGMETAAYAEAYGMAPEDVTVEDMIENGDATPVFAGDEWDEHPVCDNCGETAEDVGLTPRASSTKVAYRPGFKKKVYETNLEDIDEADRKKVRKMRKMFENGYSIDELVGAFSLNKADVEQYVNKVFESEKVEDVEPVVKPELEEGLDELKDEGGTVIELPLGDINEPEFVELDKAAQYESNSRDPRHFRDRQVLQDDLYDEEGGHISDELNSWYPSIYAVVEGEMTVDEAWANIEDELRNDKHYVFSEEQIPKFKKLFELETQDESYQKDETSECKKSAKTAQTLEQQVEPTLPDSEDLSRFDEMGEDDLRSNLKMYEELQKILADSPAGENIKLQDTIQIVEYINNLLNKPEEAGVTPPELQTGPEIEEVSPEEAQSIMDKTEGEFDEAEIIEVVTSLKAKRIPINIVTKEDIEKEAMHLGMVKTSDFLKEAPAILERCVRKVMADGKSKSSAYAICIESLRDKHPSVERWVHRKKAEVEKMSKLEDEKFENLTYEDLRVRLSKLNEAEFTVRGSMSVQNDASMAEGARVLKKIRTEKDRVKSLMNFSALDFEMEAPTLEIEHSHEEVGKLSGHLADEIRKVASKQKDFDWETYLTTGAKILVAQNQILQPYPSLMAEAARQDIVPRMGTLPGRIQQETFMTWLENVEKERIMVTGEAERPKKIAKQASAETADPRQLFL